MEFRGFLGGSYEAEAWTADVERTVNWYPEIIESEGATRRVVLMPTPGVRTLWTPDVTVSYIGTDTGGGISTFLSSSVNLVGRAHYAIAGREFAVIGDQFVEFGSDGSAQIATSSLAIDDNPATISAGGDLTDKLLITSGGNAYTFDLTTNALTEITALSGKATMGGYLDGYGLVLDANTSTLYISALGDLSSWTTGTDYAQRSLAPDPWVSMAVVGRYIWLLGEQTSEAWYNIGATFPFAPHPSGTVALGCVAPFGPAIVGADLAWVAQNAAGRRCVVVMSGFTPKIISTTPLEKRLQDYPDAESGISFSYSDRGHTFYVMSFDRSRATWAWDQATGLWSERGTWEEEYSRYNFWRPRWPAFAFGQQRCLDASQGLLYELSGDYARDVPAVRIEGTGLSAAITLTPQLIRRMRRAPALSQENKRSFFSAMEVELEPGVGLSPRRASFSATSAGPV